MRRFPRFLHHLFRDSGLSPAAEVLVDPSEIVWAGRRRICRRLAYDRGVSRAGLGRVPRRAVQSIDAIFARAPYVGITYIVSLQDFAYSNQ